MKYVVFSDLFVIVFSATENHDDVARRIGKKPVSAGFVNLHDGELSTSGHSFTLGIDSRAEDAELIRRQLSFYW